MFVREPSCAPLDGVTEPGGFSRATYAIPMRPSQIVPLVVATALFMENTDSHGDRHGPAGHRPQPRRGSDRPEARAHGVSRQPRDLHPNQRLDGRPLWRAHDLSRRPRGVHGGVAGLRRVRFARRLRRRARVPGHWRGDDGAGRPSRHPSGGAEERTRQRPRLPDDPSPDRPDHGAAAGWADHHLSRLALDLLHQHPDRLGRNRPVHDLFREHPRAVPATPRRPRLPALGSRPRHADARPRLPRAPSPAGLRVLGLPRRRRDPARALPRPFPPGRASRDPPRSAEIPDLPRGGDRWQPVPHRHRGDPVPAAADAADRLRPRSAAIGPSHLRRGGRRAPH